MACIQQTSSITVWTRITEHGHQYQSCQGKKEQKKKVIFISDAIVITMGAENQHKNFNLAYSLPPSFLPHLFIASPLDKHKGLPPNANA